jgi:hypothetical protein
MLIKYYSDMVTLPFMSLFCISADADVTNTHLGFFLISNFNTKLKEAMQTLQLIEVLARPRPTYESQKCPHKSGVRSRTRQHALYLFCNRIDKSLLILLLLLLSFLFSRIMTVGIKNGEYVQMIEMRI